MPLTDAIWFNSRNSGKPLQARNELDGLIQEYRKFRYEMFRKNNKCLKWMDYEMTRHELEEADELCHGNWIEIQRRNEYMQTLKSMIIPFFTL